MIPEIAYTMGEDRIGGLLQQVIQTLQNYGVLFAISKSDLFRTRVRLCKGCPLSLILFTTFKD